MDKNQTYKPLLAVTMGDPAGIGPEIAAITLINEYLLESCRPVLIGSLSCMVQTIKQMGLCISLNNITSVSHAIFNAGIINIINVDEDNSIVEKGVVSAKAGDIAFKAVVKAIDLAMKNEVDATVTGPINKEAINKAGHHFSGHTEIYAHYTNTPKYAMLLVDEGFAVIHVTTHVSLRQACDLIKKQRVLDVIHLIDRGLNDIGIEQPRIGVAGLNPHSGDGGLFGTEEIEEIGPAIDSAKAEGINVTGPVPPDTLFSLAKGGKFDGCVAMYHDQGHIPFKLMGFDWDQKNQSMKSVKGVNITLGLPIIRTSVDHGTAFEIAGKGIASPDALFHAIEYAIKLTKSKKK